MSISENRLGELIKGLLRENSMSMRSLAELTEIDVATISRITNGKRKANLHHLEKFSHCLDIPLTDFLIAAGYPIKAHKGNHQSDIHSSIEKIKNILIATDSYDNGFSIEAVDEQLTTFGQYSQTKEGEDTILNSFEDKIEKVGSIGPFIEQLKELFSRFRNSRGTTYELVIIGSALLYFISPIDVIPDYIFPIDYLDDAIAVQMSFKALQKK